MLGPLIADQLALKGRNEPKWPIYTIIYFAIYFSKFLIPYYYEKKYSQTYGHA